MAVVRRPQPPMFRRFESVIASVIVPPDTAEEEEDMQHSAGMGNNCCVGDDPLSSSTAQLSRMHGANGQRGAKSHSRVHSGAQHNHVNDVDESLAATHFCRVRLVHATQTGLLAGAFVSCAAMAYCISQINYVVGQSDCILGANWALSSATLAEVSASTNSNSSLTSPGTNAVADRLISPVKETENGKYFRLDAHRSQWGRPAKCDWTQYGFVGASILAFILCWFFVLFRPYKEAFMTRRSTSSTRLVLPTLVMSLLLSIFCTVCSVLVMNGVTQWCRNLTGTLAAMRPGESSSCSRAAEVYVMRENDDTMSQRDFLGYAVAAQVFAWISVAAWLATFLLVMSRFMLHLDFPAYYFSYASDKASRRRSQLHTVTQTNGCRNNGPLTAGGTPPRQRRSPPGGSEHEQSDICDAADVHQQQVATPRSTVVNVVGTPSGRAALALGGDEAIDAAKFEAEVQLASEQNSIVGGGAPVTVVNAPTTLSRKLSHPLSITDSLKRSSRQTSALTGGDNQGLSHFTGSFTVSGSAPQSSRSFDTQPAGVTPPHSQSAPTSAMADTGVGVGVGVGAGGYHSVLGGAQHLIEKMSSAVSSNLMNYAAAVVSADDRQSLTRVEEENEGNGDGKSDGDKPRGRLSFSSKRCSLPASTNTSPPSARLSTPSRPAEGSNPNTPTPCSSNRATPVDNRTPERQYCAPVIENTDCDAAVDNDTAPVFRSAGVGEHRAELDELDQGGDVGLALDRVQIMVEEDREKERKERRDGGYERLE